MFQGVRSAEEEVGVLLRNEQKNSEECGLNAGADPSRNINHRWKSRDEVGQYFILRISLFHIKSRSVSYEYQLFTMNTTSLTTG